jgi:hypothetical protein
MEEEVLTKFQEAWDSSEKKDERVVRLNDLERAYWMGTEVGLLGGYGFQGVTLGVEERWGPDAANSGRKERANVRESAERRKARARTGQSWEGLY